MAEVAITEREALDRAVVLHSKWKTRLALMVGQGRLELTPSEAAQEDGCPLGLWLGDAPLVGREGRLDRLLEAHRAFHQEAARIVALQAGGRHDEAAAALVRGAPFEATSDRIIALLHDWKQAL